MLKGKSVKTTYDWNTLSSNTTCCQKWLLTSAYKQFNYLKKLLYHCEEILAVGKTYIVKVQVRIFLLYLTHQVCGRLRARSIIYLNQVLGHIKVLLKDGSIQQACRSYPNHYSKTTTINWFLTNFTFINRYKIYFEVVMLCIHSYQIQ